MKKRVTIQDIADELKLSRNTVSKAINGTGNIAPETKDRIFQKAGELGYKQFGFLQQPSIEREKPAFNREIALFTHSVLGSLHFSSALLNSFQKKISALGYRLTFYMLRDDIISNCIFPENFNTESTDAILVIELFDKSYTNFLCDCGIPTLFVDTFANPYREFIASDILLMENQNSVYRLVASLVNNGCKNIGFIGDYLHCQSFYERWLGYTDSMKANSNTNYEELCILENDASPYDNPIWMAQKIKNLSIFPDAFFCANDFLAVCTAKALKILELRLPQDIKIAGFDNSLESQIIEPPLTTVAIPGHEIGYTATNLLLNRIQYPNAPYTITYTHTDIIYRQSTHIRIDE